MLQIINKNKVIIVVISHLTMISDVILITLLFICLLAIIRLRGKFTKIANGTNQYMIWFIAKWFLIRAIIETLCLLKDII